MQKTYKSLYGQLAYVIIAGLQLVFVPNLLLGIFGFQPTSEIWIRVMGLLVLALSFYYYAMVNHGTPEVVKATVYGRTFFCLGLITLVIIGIAEPPLIGFAIAELALTAWTWSELRAK